MLSQRLKQEVLVVWDKYKISTGFVWDEYRINIDLVHG